MRISFVLLVGLLVATQFPIAPAYSRPDVLQYPFKYDLQPVDSIKGPGKATYEFTVWNNPRFPKDDLRCKEEITLRLTTHGNLVNLGPSEWRIKPIDTSKIHILIEIDIPDNDTTGFTLEGPCWVGPRSVYFVTTGYYPLPAVIRYPIEVFDGDPHDPTVHRRIKQPWEYPPQGERRKGDWPLLDSLWGNIGIKQKDTSNQPFIKVEVFHHDEDSLKRARVEWEIRNRETLEQSPLVGQQYEYLIVDGQMLMRKEGETKFYPVKPEQRRHIWDSLRHLTESKR